MNITEVMAPEIDRIRAYFAPVNRAAQQPTIFDPAQSGAFALDAPPAPWVDLGWISGFKRTSGTTVVALKTGAPAGTSLQSRTDVEAIVQFAFDGWGKLQMSLAAGTQQMNLLAVQGGAAPAGSGGAAVAAIQLSGGSTVNALQVGSVASTFKVGSLIAVDVDYVPGTLGVIGSGVSGAYVNAPLSDLDYVRRVTLNVGRVSSVSGGVLTLEAPLLAGTPTNTMKVSAVAGFCDREGSSFFQEWSALFVAEGQQGERVIWHYPRLQASGGIREEVAMTAGGYEAVRLAGTFRGLPVTDSIDGERVVCFRSYVAG